MFFSGIRLIDLHDLLSRQLNLVIVALVALAYVRALAVDLSAVAVVPRAPGFAVAASWVDFLAFVVDVGDFYGIVGCKCVGKDEFGFFNGEIASFAELVFVKAVIAFAGWFAVA